MGELVKGFPDSAVDMHMLVIERFYLSVSLSLSLLLLLLYAYQRALILEHNAVLIRAMAWLKT